MTILGLLYESGDDFLYLNTFLGVGEPSWDSNEKRRSVWSLNLEVSDLTRWISITLINLGSHGLQFASVSWNSSFHPHQWYFMSSQFRYKASRLYYTCLEI